MLRLFVSLIVLAASGLHPASAESIHYQRIAERRLRLSLPGEFGESWRELNVGRLQVRTTKKQLSIQAQDIPPTADLEVALEGAGCALLVVDIGPPSSRDKADSWQRVTRCSKFIDCEGASRAQRQRATAVITGKTGSRLEIRPLLNPVVLIPGSDLPVRLYYEGESVKEARVFGRGPESAVVEGTTDGVGIAFLRIPSSGRWTVGFAHRGATAELVFEVPTADD